MLMDYLRHGISTFIVSMLFSLAIFIVLCVFKYLSCVIRKKKFQVSIITSISEVLWIAIIISIFKITGIIGGDFGTTSLFNGTAVIDFSVFKEGLTIATILNMILFMPFGFFIPIIFKKIKSRWFYGILFGFVFSFIIEFLQTFTGRFVQIEDIIMNTLGTFLGYIIH